MSERYLMVTWPDIQNFMDNERWNECIFCMPIKDHPCPDSTYMVPESLYDKVMNKTLLKK